MRRLVSTIKFGRPLPHSAPTRGFLIAGTTRISCVLGRAGVRALKREGDGATPTGSLRILGGYFRSDRVGRPATRVPLKPIRPDDGWCDDPSSFQYNRPVKLPARARCERMALESRVYDVVLITSYNMKPRTRGAGSAIFVHIRRADGGPTEGCLAVDPPDLRRLLPRLSRNVKIRVG